MQILQRQQHSRWGGTECVMEHLSQHCPDHSPQQAFAAQARDKIAHEAHTCEHLTLRKLRAKVASLEAELAVWEETSQ